MLTEVFAQMIVGARSGSPRAIDALFEAYYPAVERMAHSALRAEDAYGRSRLVSLFSTGDVVQDVFRKVLRGISAFQGETEGEFVTYLMAAVRTRLLDLLRFHHAMRRDRRRTEESPDALDRVTGREQPDKILSAEEQIRIYFSVLEGVPARERALLVRRLEGKATFQTLAEELGYPSDEASRKAFCKAHARLLLQLRRHGVCAEVGVSA